MTLNVPLVDWGRKKARVNAAISMKKLADYNNDFDEKAIGEEIITTVNNLELLKIISFCQKLLIRLLHAGIHWPTVYTSWENLPFLN